MNYADVFHQLFPGFFQQDYVRAIPEGEVSVEQVLDLRASSPLPPVACPGHITFGLYQGDRAALRDAVRQVDPDWVQYFGEDDRVFCAFDGDRPVAFCILDAMGAVDGLRIGGPGCVGTLPEVRRQGVGLRMVQLATELLRAEGYDLSWIHYTYLEKWYARLGYVTVVRWDKRGVIESVNA